MMEAAGFAVLELEAETGFGGGGDGGDEEEEAEHADSNATEKFPVRPTGLASCGIRG